MRQGDVVNVLTRSVTIGAVALALLALQAPSAGADAFTSATGRSTVSFTYHGRPLSCTIEGKSSVEYLSDFARSNMDASTELVDSDAACEQAHTADVILATFERKDQDGGSFGASGRLPTSAFAAANGVVSHLSVQHIAWFACDNPPFMQSVCGASVNTSPK